ncbi:MAG TPA: TRAP transporter small permease [Gammaproteobacteria bacterium]|nr:TRAP transporter small permease [Gammaproteobacteria bacterium]
MTSTTSPGGSRLEQATRRWLVAPLFIAARITIIAMCVTTLADIAGRHLLGLPIPGIIELAELALVWSAFAGIAAAFWTGAHVGVELIELFVSRTGLAVIRLVNTLIVLALMACLAWLAVTEFLDTLTWGDRTTVLAIPYTWFWAAVVVGYTASVVLLAVRVSVLWQSRPAA